MKKRAKLNLIAILCLGLIAYSTTAQAANLGGGKTGRVIITPEWPDCFEPNFLHIGQDKSGEVTAIYSARFRPGYMTVMNKFPAQGQGPESFQIKGVEECRKATQVADGGFILAELFWAPNKDRFETDPAGFRLIKINAEGVITWDRRLEMSNFFLLHDLKATPDGSFWILLYEQQDGPRLRVIKFDGKGERLLEGTHPLEEETASMRMTINGRGEIIVAGSYLGFKEKAPFLIKLDPNGALVNRSLLAESFSAFFSAMGNQGSHPFISNLLVTTDGGYLLAGYAIYVSDDIKEKGYWQRDRLDDRENALAFAAKINPEGGRQWEYLISSKGRCRLIAALERDDGYVLAGSSNLLRVGIAPYGKFFFEKISLQGKKLWSRAFGYMGKETKAQAGADAENKEIIIAGSIAERALTYYTIPILIKTDENGKTHGPEEVAGRMKEGFDLVKNGVEIVLYSIAATFVVILIYLVNGPDPFP